MNEYETAVIAGICCALLGAWITHRFQIGRDKILAYNKVVIPLRKILLRHQDELMQGSVQHRIMEKDIDALRVIFPEPKFNKLKLEFQSYQEKYFELITRDKYGNVNFEPNVCDVLLMKLKPIINLVTVK